MEETDSFCVVYLFGPETLIMKVLFILMLKEETLTRTSEKVTDFTVFMKGMNKVVNHERIVIINCQCRCI